MHTFARFKFDKMLELAKVQSNIYMMEIEYNDLYNLIREMRFAQRFVDSNRYSSTEKLSNHYWRLILEFKKMEISIRSRVGHLLIYIPTCLKI